MLVLKMILSTIVNSLLQLAFTALFHVGSMYLPASVKKVSQTY